MSYREITINGQQIKLIPLGDCACGCGGKTNLAKEDNKQKKREKGRPNRFVHGHNNAGANHWEWKNGRALTHSGYVGIRDRTRSHARVNFNRYVREHILIAEKALGKPLPPEAVVHHIDHDKSNNRRGNLVICQDQAYHLLLHHREKALKACGNPNFRACRFCKKWDDPNNMVYTKVNFTYYHRDCRNKYRRERYKLTGKT